MLDLKLEEIYDQYLNHEDIVIFRINRLIVNAEDADDLTYWFPWELRKSSYKIKIIHEYIHEHRIKNTKKMNYFDALYENKRLYCITDDLDHISASKPRLDFRDIISLDEFRLEIPSDGILEWIVLDKERKYTVIEVHKRWWA